MGILAIASDYWRVWWLEAKAISGVQFHHEGLFHTCLETTINSTIVAADKCTDLHTLGRPGILTKRNSLFLFISYTKFRDIQGHTCKY